MPSRDAHIPTIGVEREILEPPKDEVVKAEVRDDANRVSATAGDRLTFDEINQQAKQLGRTRRSHECISLDGWCRK